jgi:hypothetical protein
MFSAVVTLLKKSLGSGYLGKLLSNESLVASGAADKHLGDT